MRIPGVTLSRPVERRDGERHGVEIDISVTSESNFYTGVTENVSQGGLFVVSEKLPDIGTIMAVRFSLPGDPRAIECTGEVRWHRTGPDDEGERGYGIRFIDLEEEASERITAFLQVRTPIVHPDA